MKSKKAKAAMNNWTARGSDCPICKQPFRSGCSHTVDQAKTKLFENYISAIANKN